MSLIKKNIFANFTGTIWQALMSFLFVPLYIKLIGIESWGLIGVFSLVQTIFSLLDMGLSSTLSRELARLSALDGESQTMKNLVKTLEFVYWGLALFVGITFLSISPFLAKYWFNSKILSINIVLNALMAMGIVMALQMPIGFYSGGLIGLQKQIKLNIINSSISTLRGIGGVMVLWLFVPTIQAYFIWQIFVSSLNLFLLVNSLKKSLPESNQKAIFQKKLLQGISKFAAGMTGIIFLSIILTQLDKIILSKMLSLEEFGYYTLASVVAMSLSRFTNPIMTAIYPRMTQLVSINDQSSLIKLYHENCQFIAVLIMPITMIIFFFSHEILLIWTNNEVTANKTYLLVSILTLGTGFFTIMILPYTLQIANGWTSLSLYKNIVAVVVLVPLIFFLTKRYGSIGAASAWLMLNLGYILFEIPLLHRKLLKNEKWRWYIYDFIIPLIVSVIFVGICRVFYVTSFSKFASLLYIIITMVLAFILTSLSTVTTKKWVLTFFHSNNFFKI
jgi:O-antigen/teichoic acid export membrane protein